MEFNIDVNALLRDPITKIDGRLQICRDAGLRFPDCRLQLFDIINKMGEASARAQGLPGAITTGRKLETSDHHLYIMKDTEGQRGHGAVVGILKIGRKRLFVYDRHGQQWEMNPLCVLDFYVHESRQRKGCGRRLFDSMLQNEHMSAQHLAVDRPSHKFSSFLAKHYGLRTEIPQVNNFVIFDGFFTKRPDGDFIHNRRNANVAKPADYPSTDRTEKQPAHVDSNYSKKKRGGYQPGGTGWPAYNSRPPSGHRNNTIAAGVACLLPRHDNSQQDNSLKELNLNPRQSVHSSGKHSPKGLTDLELRSVSAGSGRQNGAGGLQLQAAMYSRHQTLAPRDGAVPEPQYTLAQPAPPTANRPPSGLGRNTTGLHRPPSAKNGVAKREKSPPLRTRDGPANDYLQYLNMHQNYQGRSGHLVVPPDPRQGLPQTPVTMATTTTTSPTKTENSALSHLKSGSQPGLHSYRGGYYPQQALQANGDTSWTVFGVLRKQQQLSARNYGHSRLW